MAAESLNPDRIEALRRRIAGLRVALVHDWLLGMRGGERVLEALLSLLPRAEIYTLFYDPRGVSSAINRRAVYPSPLMGLPGVGRYYRSLLPVMPSVIGRLRIRPGVDLVLSTSHCVAHGACPPEGARHLTYCFSPMRYLHGQRAAYERGGAAWGAKVLGAFAVPLKRWDRAAARRCGHYRAISGTVASRIASIYGLQAPVVYPPVNTDFFTPASFNEGAKSDASAPFLVVSSLTPYKRVDVAIEAANALRKRLIVVGKGPLEPRLRRLAGATVRFEGWIGDERLRELYRSCAALIFPGEEDFGIVPVEAMACGRPVLALRTGGLTETHVEGRTGAFFDRPGWESLAEAWEQFDPSAHDPGQIRRHAERFSTGRFLDEFTAMLGEFLDL